MAHPHVNSEIVNGVLVIHVTDNVIPFREVFNALKDHRPVFSVVIYNHAPDYIPDSHSMGYLLDIVSGPMKDKTKLAIIPTTYLQQAMFELVLDDLHDANVEVGFFQAMDPALGWLHASI